MVHVGIDLYMVYIGIMYILISAGINIYLNYMIKLNGSIK